MRARVLLVPALIPAMALLGGCSQKPGVWHALGREDQGGAAVLIGTCDDTTIGRVDAYDLSVLQLRGSRRPS